MAAADPERSRDSGAVLPIASDGWFTLTSHIDLMPTLLGLAVIQPEPIRKKLALDHSDARPLAGRDLNPLVLDEVGPAPSTNHSMS